MAILDPSAFLVAVIMLAINSYPFLGGSLVYDIAQDLEIAAVVGYTAVTSYENIINIAWNPMMTNFAANWNYIIPIVLSCLLFFLLTRRYVWVSRWPTSYMMGVGLGLAIASLMYSDIYMQIVQGFTLGFGTLNWIVIVVGMPLVIWFFIYTIPHGKGTTRSILDRLADGGKAFVMVYIASKYASTVMYRLTMLIGVLQRVFWDWLGVAPPVFG
jgi:hypothetical protein